MSRFWWEQAQPYLTDAGFLPFDAFMELSLYHPQCGYYMKPDVKWGADGDFTTAPMMSSAFAYSLGKTAMSLNPTADCWIELGPGRGDLAAQMLSFFPSIKEYWCIEPSESQQRHQSLFFKKCLPKGRCASIRWSKTIPRAQNAVVLANEILDAQVAKRVVYHQGRFQEQGFRWQDDHWVLAMEEPSAFLLDQCHTLAIPKLEGYTTELRPNLHRWFDGLDPIEKGFCLLMDYGYLRHQYYHPERITGTLRSYRNHRFCHQPELWMGDVDVSVSVDWDQVGECALKKGWSLHSFQTQAEWLMQHEVPNEHRRGLVELIHSEMGETVKMAVIKK